MRPLERLSILDVGCGGGLVCEPLARLGAAVTGIDPATENIEAARRHAAGQDLDIDYRAARIEDLVAEGRSFDAVACLEVVEHVPDVGAFLKICAALVRPGGLMLLSTINRTTKAYLLAIVGAEYVLRWLPVGTHQWDRFVTPEELGRHLGGAGLGVPVLQGLIYSPFSDIWALSRRHRRQLLRGCGQARLSEAVLYLSSRLPSPGLDAHLVMRASLWTW